MVAPKANNSLTVTVTGPGTLVGLDAGDSTNHDSYKGTTHAAFSGKLMAIIQSSGTAGTVTVSASGSGLTAGIHHHHDPGAMMRVIAAMLVRSP